MKNAYVELFRFIGSLVIMGHHIIFLSANYSRSCFEGGWIFVEFFFMLSGYWATVHFTKVGAYGTKEIIYYVYSKVRRILPFALVGIFISYICANLRGPTTLYEHTTMFLDLLLSIIFLGPNLAVHAYNNQTWYVSQLIFVLPAIVFLMSACKNIYKYYICWAVPIFLYTYAHSTYGSIVAFNNTTCLIRGISGIMLGSALYYIIEYFRGKSCQITEVKKKYNFLRTFFMWCCLAFLLVSHFFASFEDASAGYIFVVFIMLFATLYEENDCLKKGMLYNFFLHLGKLSLPVFCIHTALMETVQLLIPQRSILFKLSVSVLLVIAISEILLAAVNKFSTRKKFLYKLRNGMI